MELSGVCKWYFDGFKDIYNNNDLKRKVTGALRILSYFTVVIPLAFAAVYGTASLLGRVSKKQSLSNLDNQVDEQGKKLILKTTNIPLAQNEACPTVPKKVFSSPLIEELHAKLEKADASYEKQKILLEIAAEEIKEKNSVAADLALDEATKILDEKFEDVNGYCDVAKMRIQLRPDYEPHELKKASEIEERELSKYPGKFPLPPFYLCHHMIAIAKCYHLLKFETMVSKKIEDLKDFSEKFINRSTNAYVGVFEESAKFQIESGRFEEAANIINTIIIPKLNSGSSEIDMEPAIACCVKLATVLIDHGHLTEPLDKLIEVAEFRFSPWKDKTGSDVERRRNLIKKVTDRMGQKMNIAILWQKKS